MINPARQWLAGECFGLGCCNEAQAFARANVNGKKVLMCWGPSEALGPALGLLGTVGATFGTKGRHGSPAMGLGVTCTSPE